MIRVVAYSLLSLFAATILAGAPPASPTAAGAMPAVGDIAKDFTLKTPGGEAVTLSKLTAKSPVVLIVLRGWPGYQCPICTKQVGELISHEKELSATGAQLVLVYPGPSEYLNTHAEEFVKGKGLPDSFRFVVDPNYTFTTAYGLRWDAPNETAYPSTFIIDTENRIRFAKISKTHGGRADVATIINETKKLK